MASRFNWLWALVVVAAAACSPTGGVSAVDSAGDTADVPKPPLPDGASPDAAALDVALPDGGLTDRDGRAPDAEAPDALADVVISKDVPDVPDVPDSVTPDGSGPAPDANDPYAGLTKVYNTTCTLMGQPAPPPLLALEQVLENLEVVKPVQLLTAPDGSGRIFVVSQPGRVHVASGLDDASVGAVWLDIVDKVEDGPNEAGLLSIAFDPDFTSNGRVFASYTRATPSGLQSVISRFTVSNPPLGAPAKGSEKVVFTLDQPYGNHNGGQIAFGPDGMLYVGLGDGGSGGDPHGHGQNLATLLGAILRIDVSGPSGYTVPPDNPFVQVSSARGEIWAYGLRNPWRFGFDPVEGTLWAGDVGQNAVEEIDIIKKGGNYGWDVMEGTACFQPPTACDTSGKVLPVAEYPHSEGKSVTGGHVYRGSAMPSLYGTYLYGDFTFGTVLGLTPGDDGYSATMLVQTDALISAFGYGPDGESYVLDWQDGRVLRLVPANPDEAGDPGWPPTLAATGCFSNVAAAELAPGILRYDINVPLWSDGADKERGLVLPDGSAIGFTETGAWDLPEGTILIKTFSLGGKRLETRFLVTVGDTVRGATYRWNDAQTDAYLLSGSATQDLGEHTWYFPSRGDCTTCHTKASGALLGVTTPQLNREHVMFEGKSAVHQIDALAHLGYFAQKPPPSEQLERFPAPTDASAPVGDRARAYLHANCAHCHMPGGLASATIDLRHTAPLPATGCGAPAQQGDLGVAGALVVAPGDPGKSTLWLRMATTESVVRMPPLATSVVDEQAIDLVSDWLLALQGCSP